jgi:hypothetical protein
MVEKKFVVVVVVAAAAAALMMMMMIVVNQAKTDDCSDECMAPLAMADLALRNSFQGDERQRLC